MAARVTAQDKAKNALAAGIVRTFEERKRAEVELAKGREEALATLNELQKIFEELQVKDDGMQALEREGTYTKIQSWFTFPRDQQIKAMQAVLKFRDTYSFVLEARSRAEEMGRSNIGQAYAGTPRPLTGPFSPVTAPTLSTGLPSNVGPLLLDAGLDTGLTQEYLKDVSDIRAKLTQDLEVIKGSKLEGDYDTQMYGKLYGIRFQRAYWSHMFRVAGQSGSLISTVQAWRQTQRHSLSEDAFKKDQALGKDDAALLEEFKQYYAQAKASISIAGPKNTKPSTPVNLAATVTFQTKPEPQYEIRWSDVTRGQALPRGGALTFTPGDAQTYRVKAEAFATIQGKEQKIAETFHDIAVTRDDTKKDDKTDGKPATGDPKGQAEEKYRWLKESVAYLEALKEFDRKSYNAFEKSVTGSIVREFVSKAPPQNEKGFKLPDGNDKELCGETFGDIKGRLTGYDSDCWSALNTGCKTIGTRETTRTVDGKEMKILESVTSCDAPCGKASTCSTVLMTYTGQLGYANSLQDYVNERQIKCLADAGGAHGKHQRELDAEDKEPARVAALQTLPGIRRPERLERLPGRGRKGEAGIRPARPDPEPARAAVDLFEPVRGRRRCGRHVEARWSRSQRSRKRPPTNPGTSSMSQPTSPAARRPTRTPGRVTTQVRGRP